MQMPDLYEIARSSRASQDRFELHNLLLAVRKTNPKVIVEIGVHRGYSLEVWWEAFKPELLVGIDNEPDIDPELMHGSDEPGMIATIMRHDSHEPDTLERLKRVLDGRHIDFLFIDGDHHYEGVRSDWLMYSPLVRKGGIVAFHDVMRVGPEWVGKVETRQVFDEERRNYASAEFWGPTADAPGTGILFV